MNEYHVTAFEDAESVGTFHAETLGDALYKAIDYAQALWMIPERDLAVATPEPGRWEVADGAPGERPSDVACKVVVRHLGGVGAPRPDA
jgi:hypothetical protein